MSSDFDSLPNELVRSIMEYLPFEDLCHASMISQRFNVLAQDEELWRNLFALAWPGLYEELYQNSNKAIASSWKSEFSIRYLYGLNTRKECFEMSKHFYRDAELSEDAFNGLKNYHYKIEHKFGVQFQLDELYLIVNDGQINNNLTLKFYAEKALRSFKHESMKTKWTRYIEESQFKPIDDEPVNLVNQPIPLEDAPGDLITGATFISEWFQTRKNIYESKVRDDITNLAFLVKEALKEINMNNAFFTLGGEILSDSDATSLNESRFGGSDCKQILRVISATLFSPQSQVAFNGNQQFYYEEENSYIDKVVERRLGIPITLCILYQAIASKLGVKTFPVSNPGHFLLAWYDKDGFSGADIDITYIDPFNNGKLSQGLPNVGMMMYVSQASNIQIAKPLSVFRRMVSNLIEVGRQQEVSNDGLLCLRNGLELMILICPDDIEPALLLCRVYIHLSINHEQVVDILNRVSQIDRNSVGVVMFLKQQVEAQILAKRRQTSKNNSVKLRSSNPEVLFAVGMVMRHKKYNYRCVIYSWDKVCTASKDWIFQMGVNQLQNKDKQPFYNVLVDDGSSRYAAQENLAVDLDPNPINHSEVGRYFMRFNGTFYESNQEKCSEYPEDTDFVKD